MTSCEGEVAGRTPALDGIRLCPQVKASQFALHGTHVFKFKEQREDSADGFGLELIHHETALFTLIAEWHPTSHPHALFLGGCDLVANALAGYFALELRKGKQHIQREAPHRGCRIKLLGH